MKFFRLKITENNLRNFFHGIRNLWKIYGKFDKCNTYKFIIERNYSKKIKELILVRLHPESEEETYELIPLPDLSKEIADLFSEKIKI